MLLIHEVGKYSEHARTAEQLAKDIETSGNHFLAQQYLELAMRLHLAGKNEEAARRVRLEKAESLVRHAQAVVNRPGQGYITGAHFLAMGIECLRQAQAPDATIEAFHKQLREWQDNSLKEMETFSHEMDIIRRICPRVTVMIAGKVAAEGPLEEIARREDVVTAYLGRSLQ